MNDYIDKYLDVKNYTVNVNFIAIDNNVAVTMKNTEKAIDAVKEKSEKAKASFSGFSSGLFGAFKSAGDIMGKVIQGVDKLPDDTIDISSSLDAAKKQVDEGLVGIVVAIDTSLNEAGFGGITEVITNVSTMISSFLENIATMVPGIMEPLISIFTFLEPVIPIILGIIAAFVIAIKVVSIITAISEAITLLSGAMSFLASSPILLIVGAIVGLIAVFVYLWNTNEDFRNAVLAIWEAIKTGISVIIAAIVSFFQGLVLGVLNMALGVINAWNNIKATVSAVVAAFVAFVQQKWSEFLQGTMAIFTTIKDWLINVWETIKNTVSNVFTNIVNAGKQAWEGLKQSVSDTVSSVKELFGKLGEINLLEIGKNIVEGLINGVKEKISAVTDMIGNVASKIKNGFKSALGINSPSRWMRDYIGKFIPMGVAVGIDQHADVVDGSMDNLANRIKMPALANINGTLNGVVSQSITGKNEWAVQEKNQPATFNLNLGNQKFKAFVADISQAIGQETDINLSF